MKNLGLNCFVCSGEGNYQYKGYYKGISDKIVEMFSLTIIQSYDTTGHTAVVDEANKRYAIGGNVADALELLFPYV